MASRFHFHFQAVQVASGPGSCGVVQQPGRAQGPHPPTTIRPTLHPVRLHTHVPQATSRLTRSACLEPWAWFPLPRPDLPLSHHRTEPPLIVTSLAAGIVVRANLHLCTTRICRRLSLYDYEVRYLRLAAPLGATPKRSITVGRQPFSRPAVLRRQQQQHISGAAAAATTPCFALAAR